MSNTCESCGGKLFYVAPTVQHCEGGENERGPYDGCDAIYIDGIRYVPYEERRCDTCRESSDDNGIKVYCHYLDWRVPSDYSCKSWRRKE